LFDQFVIAAQQVDYGTRRYLRIVRDDGREDVKHKGLLLEIMRKDEEG
jgi:hypothetical protein